MIVLILIALVFALVIYGECRLLTWWDRSHPYAPTPAARETTLLWVCTDCIVLHANGEEPADPTEYEPLSLIPEDADVTMGLLWEEHADDCANRAAEELVEECSCETREFSHSRCDGCGNLPGTRHALTLWTEPVCV